MKSIQIYLLCFLVLFSGCKTIKRTFGFGEEEEKQSPKNPTTKIVPPVPSDKVAITSTTLSNWVLYSLITLAILFTIRYGVKKMNRKDK